MTSITIREYVARDGSEFNKADAAIIGPVISELAKQGGVTARDVLDTARSTNSPIHRFFEWDDKVAADEYRLYQARSMLRSIRVRYVEGGVTHEARAFEVTRKAPFEDAPRQYRSFQVLHGDSAFAAQMMENALDDLVRWRTRYEPYTGMWMKFGDLFQEVVNQIGELEDGVRSENPTIETDDALAKLLAWKEEFADALVTWTHVREEVEYIMAAIGSAEEAFCKLKTKSTKHCVRCGDEFLTLDDGMRTCPKCRQAVTYQTASQRLPAAIE